MSKYWFKAKRYGWGAGFPISWEGWLVMMFLLLLIFIAGFVDGIFVCPVRLKAILRFILDTVLLIALSLILIEDKIEGGLKWRWGEKV